MNQRLKKILHIIHFSLKAGNYALVTVKRIKQEKILNVSIQKGLESKEKERTVCRGKKTPKINKITKKGVITSSEGGKKRLKRKRGTHLLLHLLFCGILYSSKGMGIRCKNHTYVWNKAYFHFMWTPGPSCKVQTSAQGHQW